MNRVQLKLISSLEKVFPDQAPIDYPEEAPLSGMTNEVISFQAAFCGDWDDAGRKDYVTLVVDSPLKEYIRLRRVRCVPVMLAAFEDSDDNYLRKDAGLYPDLLENVSLSRLRMLNHVWQSVWVDIESEAGLPAGTYPIRFALVNDDGETLAEAEKSVTIIAAALPEQKLIHTKWFYADCLASYYNVEVFSEEHWRIVENFAASAAKRGINMLLTPIHTPPLDTRVGTERPTVQLVDVYVNDGKYSFGFENLERWVRMGQRVGMKYFEMAHLFTQWGAGFTPKIVANVDGVMKRIFGWDVPVGESYGEFLSQYLPALTAEIKRLGIADVTRFHISDEPNSKHLEQYLASKKLAAPYLEGFTIMDALSDYAFYTQGVVTSPVPATNHIEPFLEGNVPNLWTYYCVGQYKEVSNMFLAMPSARNRILAEQLYKFNIKGFLQWGFNFYYSQYSDYLVDPHYVTDADGFAPAGDAFQVYPGRGGVPEESIRMMVTSQAMYDLRAMELLESLTSREHVMAIMEENLSEPITFKKYPHLAQWLLNFRAKINREIAANLK